MQVRWNKKLPKHYLHSVSQSVSSHQGGRSFARVTHLSVQPSKSKIRRSFPMAFFNPQPWTEQMPPGGGYQRKGLCKAQPLPDHRCFWLASCSKAPLSSLFFSVCTVQTHSINFMTFTAHAGAAAIRAFFFRWVWPLLPWGSSPENRKRCQEVGRVGQPTLSTSQFMASPMIREAPCSSLAKCWISSKMEVKPNFAVSATEDQWCHSPEVVGQSLARTPGPEKS